LKELNYLVTDLAVFTAFLLFAENIRMSIMTILRLFRDHVSKSDLFSHAIDGFVVFFGAWTLYCHALTFYGANFNTLIHVCVVPIMFAFSLLYILPKLNRIRLIPRIDNKIRYNNKIRRGARVPRSIKILSAFLIASAYPWVGNYFIFWAISVFFLILVIYDTPTPDLPNEQTNQIQTKWEKGGVILLAVFAVMITLIAHRPDIDDAHYMSFVTSALDFPERSLMRSDGMFGERNLPLLNEHYRVHTYELFVALMSFLSRLDYRFLYYMIFPGIFAVFVVVSHWLALRQLSGKGAFIGLLVSIVVLVSWGDVHRTYGNFAFVRLFQNKGLLVSICVPAIVYYAAKFSSSCDLRSWVLLGVSQIVAFGISGTGITIAPITSFLVLCASWRLNWKSTCMLFMGLLSSIYPVGVGLLITMYGFPRELAVVPLLAMSCLLFCLFRIPKRFITVCLILMGVFLLSNQYLWSKEENNGNKDNKIIQSGSPSEPRVTCRIPGTDVSPIFPLSSGFSVDDDVIRILSNGQVTSDIVPLKKGHYRVIIYGKGTKGQSYTNDEGFLEVAVLNKNGQYLVTKTILLSDRYENIVGPIFKAASGGKYTVGIRFADNRRFKNEIEADRSVFLKEVYFESADITSIGYYWWDRLKRNFAAEVLGTGSRSVLALFALLALPIIFMAITPDKRLVKYVWVTFLIVFNPVISPLLTMSTGIQPWRLFWACPLPLLLGLAGSGLAGLGAQIWRLTTGSILALIFAAVFFFVPGKLTLSAKNGTRLDIPGYKVDEIGYKIAEWVIQSTNGDDIVLAPERVACWIPLFREHPKLIGVRNLYVGFMRENMGKEEFISRFLLFKFINWPEGFKKELPKVFDEIEKWSITTIVFQENVPKHLSFESELSKLHYTLSLQELGYEIWERRD
jgi:hypothetical protein